MWEVVKYELNANRYKRKHLIIGYTKSSKSYKIGTIEMNIEFQFNSKSRAAGINNTDIQGITSSQKEIKGSIKNGNFYAIPPEQEKNNNNIR